MEKISNDDLMDLLKYDVVVDEYGTTKYFNSKKQLHRDEGPALIFNNGIEAWFQNGLQHRYDGPAETHPDGTQRWYIHGQFVG
jgi:hypothetical protein